MEKTFEQKVKALRNVGSTLTIECEGHLDHELKNIKDADPEMYEKYLTTLRLSK